MIFVHQEPALGHVVLEYSGPLDAQGASELASVAVLQPSTLDLVVDLSRAAIAQDLVLGYLVDALGALRCSIRGARRHHARLLRHLGARLAEPATGAEG
jgi:hypothetical protein